MNSDCFIVVTQWNQKVLKVNMKALRETLVPQNCVVFLNIDPDSNQQKLKKLIDENVKKGRKYDKVIFKECSQPATLMAVELLKKKIGSVTFFTLSGHKVPDVTNITSFNEIGIVQNEPKKAMA